MLPLRGLYVKASGLAFESLPTYILLITLLVLLSVMDISPDVLLDTYMLPLIGLYSTFCGCSPTLIEIGIGCAHTFSVFKKAGDKVIIEINKTTI